MANRRRGEVDAVLGGRSRRLTLTLGALAELEAALGEGDLGRLFARLAGGRLSAREVIAVIGAGLRGAGETTSDAEVAGWAPDEGVAALAALVGELVAASLGLPARPAADAGDGGRRDDPPAAR